MLKLIAAILVVVLGAPRQQAQELVAAKVAKLPTIDGKADDDAWKSAKELVVKIDEAGEENPKKTMIAKAVHDGDSICFLLIWEDPDKSDQHQPYVWKGAAYEVDEEKIEDFCTLGFALEGKFDSDMKAGIESKWDVWEWSAARTNPSGFALNRTHIFTKTKPPETIKSKRLTSRDQGPIYFAHPVKDGTPCYKRVDAPEKKTADILPQFVPQTPTGAAADVQAKGEWAGGKWTVEFKRKLNPGHKDETIFAVGKSVEFAIAVFDKCEKSDHLVSKNLVLKIQ
jgi:hypothetical protein